MSLSPREGLVGALLDAQEAEGWLSPGAIARCAEACGASYQEARSVASFYSRFRLAPGGRHRIQVCTGTACHVKGADAILESFRRALAVPAGSDTDPEGLFTLEEAACLGCCMIAPAVKIGPLVYGPVASEDCPALIADFLGSEAAPGEGGRRASGMKGELRLCLCSSCAAAGSLAVRDAFLPLAGEGGFRVKTVGCSGRSFEAPEVGVLLGDGRSFRYGRVRPDQAERIAELHFGARSLPARLRALPGRIARLIEGGDGPAPLRHLEGDPALAGGCLSCEHEARAHEHETRAHEHEARAHEALQTRIATEHAFLLDPLDLGEYRSRGGFEALERARRDPAGALAEIEASGLRGRGGGGFPSAAKWRAVAGAAAAERYVVCNADEGDPGAFMDRMILESFPFRVLEGFLVAAAISGAREGFFYVRDEYPLAVERLARAIELARAAGILGAFEATVVRGAGAFVCGEETALIASLAGKRGIPRLRPPYPSAEGFRGKPTLVNNVETLALVPWILREGGGSFGAKGAGASRGTKSFALAGKVARGGLVEVEMGMSLQAVVEGLGGGCPGGVKAVQVGGPSGGCVAKEALGLPVDYESLKAAGAFMGSGGIVVLDAGDCVVDLARYFLDFTRKESCGACAPCRVGTTRLWEMLEELCAGRGREGDLEELEGLSRHVKDASLCGLGRAAPNPLLSTLASFREEYEAHLRGRCPAKKCRALVRYAIKETCIGCTRCRQACPEGAIPFAPGRRHLIDQDKCTKCGLCARACPTGSVEVTS